MARTAKPPESPQPNVFSEKVRSAFTRHMSIEEEGVDIDVPSIYGMALNNLVLDERGVPTFLPVVCQYIKEFAACEGVFRKSGSVVIREELGIIFNWKECAVPPCASIHDVAVSLKKWLKELPTPLIDPEILRERYNSERPESIVEFLRSLPVLNRQCLALIFSALLAVMDRGEQNLMNASNLSTCFFQVFTHQTSFPLMEMLSHSAEYFNEDQTDFVLE